MSNDQKASELLSKSFDGLLSADEQNELDQSISDNHETANFAQLSRLIQDSVSDAIILTEKGDPTVEPGLPDDAKQRLRDSVMQAQHESRSGTLTGSDVVPIELFRDAEPGDARFAKTRFTLLRQIGQGGLGTVWLARDEDLNRTVAVKEMLPEKAESPKHLQRFQREAKITGFLEHPNVVPLYLFGVNSETGKPFYAMRFVGKQTLADAIEEYHARHAAGQTESIDLHRLLTVFLDVCQAIAYAHARGVVHRDIKPQNVALDSFGQVVVLDWGIAKVLSDGELAIQSSLGQYTSDDSVLTKTLAGEVVGTPLYMAPEQASGDLDHIDERTDVYGLGAILYTIFTGLPPHHRTSQQMADDSFKTLLKSITDCEPPAPRELNHTVPRDLEAICMRAMSKQRYGRHASAQDLANDVERWMAGQQEKRKTYEAVRLEGHNFRAHINSGIRDLCTNARFMSTLPPIQGLIDSATGQDPDGEGETVWRGRLSTIFRGLLKSNSDFVAVTFSRVIDGQSHELVRVEKPTLESEARAIPKSRLRVAETCAFGKVVIEQKPDDVHVAISPCEKTAAQGCATPLRVEAGVPVFDLNEEPFGIVAIEGDFDRWVSSQMNQRNRASSTVLVIDAQERVLIEDSERMNGLVGKSAEEALPSWSEIKQELERGNDYVDSDREIFATRVFLVSRLSSLDLVMRTS